MPSITFSIGDTSGIGAYATAGVAGTVTCEKAVAVKYHATNSNWYYTSLWVYNSTQPGNITVTITRGNSEQYTDTAAFAPNFEFR